MYFSSNMKNMKRTCLLLFAALFYGGVCSAFVLPSDDGHFCRLSQDGKALLKTDFRTAADDTLLVFKNMRVESLDSVESFEISPDGARILLSRGCGDNYVYRIESNRCDPLSASGRQYCPVFSPDGKKIAFVKDGDVYVKRLEYNTEIRVTEDGDEGVCNGRRGEDYREAFGQDFLLEFSPDGMYLLFAKDNGVRLYSLQYKWTKSISISGGDAYYVTNAKWSSDGNSIILACMDEKQVRFSLLKANASTLVAKTIYNYEATPFVSPLSATFLQIVPGKDDILLMVDKDGIRTLYRLNANGKVINAVSDGKSCVTAFYGVDGQKTYFQTAQAGSWQRDLCAAPLSGGKSSVIAGDSAVNSVCLTVSYKYLLLERQYQCSGKQVSVINTAGKQQVVLERIPGIEGRVITDVNGVPVAITPAAGQCGALVVLAAAYEDLPGWEKALSERGFTVAKPLVSINDGLLHHDWYLNAYETPAAIYCGIAEELARRKIPGSDNVVVIGKGMSAGAGIMALLAESSPFSAAVSIAPVPDLRHYSGILMHRLMLSDGATDAYRRNCPLDNVSGLDKQLLLVHAMEDENVPVRSTFDFIAAAVDAGVQMDMQIYPRKDGTYTSDCESEHLMNKICDFIK